MRNFSCALIIQKQSTRWLTYLPLYLKDPAHSWSGGLDAQLKTHDLNTDQGMAQFCHKGAYISGKTKNVFIHIIWACYPQTDTIVGTHDAPIRCVEYCPEVNVMVTGSWDRSVRLWDPRTPCNAGTFTQPEKVKWLIIFCCHAAKNIIIFIILQYVCKVYNRFHSVSFLSLTSLPVRCTHSLWLEIGWSLALLEDEFWSGIWGTWAMYSNEESPVSSIRPAALEPSPTNR